VNIIESFYPYYRPNAVYVNQKPVYFKPIINKADNTTTIEFEVPEGIASNSKAEIVIESGIVFKNLPISVTNSRKIVTLCKPAMSTPSSKIEYKWLHIPKMIEKDLSENAINVECSQPEKNITNEDESNNRLNPPIALLLMRIFPIQWIFGGKT